VSENETQWVRTTLCENIPVREGRTVELGGRNIAIFNLGDRFLAIENQCPHRGGPLADGIVSGTSVICPLHAWAFDLNSGKTVNHPESQACVATFAVRVESGMLWVEIPVADHEPASEAAACDHRDRPLRWVQRKTPPAANASLGVA
jgi:nitrite reductase (NADH) small subunit